MSSTFDPEAAVEAVLEARRVSCPRCGVPLIPGVALLPSSRVSADFEGERDNLIPFGRPTPVGRTVSAGPGRLGRCLKCPRCGFSRA